MKTQKLIGFAEYEFQVDDAGRVHSAEGTSDKARIKTAGTVTFPLTHETARSVINDIVSEVAARGEQLPDLFKFQAGELLYSEEGEVEEARMIWEAPNEQGEMQLWKQQEGDVPTFVQYKDGQFWTDGEKEPIARRHLSAVVAPDEQGTPSLHLLFDLRDNAQIVTPEATQADTYNIITSQEITILERSAANGKRGQNWKAYPKARKSVYEEKGSSYHVELALSDPEQWEDDGIVEEKMEALGQFIQEQDADFVFALFYVCNLLAPPAPLPPHATAIGWIDLEDVAEKIGWNPSKRSRDERATMRAQIWKFIQFGDRATVKGERTIPYRDKTGQVISTRIESTVWRIMDKQRPEQTEMFGEAPVSVQIAIGKQWEPLLTNDRLAQYLPLGELLGSIPTNKVAGSWARVIGLVLAGLWRRNPRETMNKTLHVTRRELLTTYTPKTATIDEILDSDKPRRAVEYWFNALEKLLDLNTIAREGEAARTVADIMKPYENTYGWQTKWLDEEVLIVPGPKFTPHIEERATALPPLKVKALPSAKRRGRPRKKRQSDS